MCSGLTGYGAIKKALPYLRAGPLLIVGLGGVGMMGLQFARALTDKPILVADIDTAKREAALKLGAAEAFDPADAGARKAICKASGGGVGAAVDFAGSDKSFAFAHAPVAKGGAAIVVGLFGGSFSMPVPMLPLRALTIMGSYVGSHGRGARDAGAGQGRQGGADPGRDAAARTRPAARSTTCAPARSSAAWWSRHEQGAMKITVMGSGGVGGYFGARLAAAGNDVTFVARGAHLEAMRAAGCASTARSARCI